MREELKPCPFCGSAQVTLHGYDATSGSKTAPECWVSCDTCGASSKTSSFPENAVAHWNTRPEAAQVRVKEISWQATDYRPNYIRSDNGIATYALTTHPDDVQLSICGTGWVPYESVSEAKAAAQANYERRIRAALEPDTVTGWQDIAAKLFCALDDIDTADDIAKDNEKLYRNLVRKAHKIRFEFQDLFPDSALPPAPEKEG